MNWMISLQQALVSHMHCLLCLMFVNQVHCLYVTVNGACCGLLKTTAESNNSTMGFISEMRPFSLIILAYGN